MSQPNFGKDPLTPSHGDSLVDQSFESLKSKEIRDSMSPTHDMNFHSLTLKHPNTTGWDVQTSSEVSPDGRAYRSETLATTDGVEKINGGTAEFKGRNEQRSSASHQGDDKNFVKKASESSNTHLQEKVVIGDENSGRTEMKMSSTSTSSSSQVISSSTVEYDDEHMPSGNRYLTDNTSRHQLQNEHNRMQRLQEEEYRQREQRQRQQQQQQQQQQQHEFEQRQRLENQTTSTQQRQQQYSQEYNTNREETSTSRNVETQNRYEENKRYVDMDKASPEYQRQVQYLMSQPGEIISNTVEYPKPNVKMITTVKRLPDGTIVKNKRYETEELRPTNEHTHQRSTTTTNQSSTQRKNERHVEEQENTRNRQQVIRETDDYVTQKSSPNRRPNADVVDNIETTHHRDHDRSSNKQQLVESYPQDQYTDDVTNITKSFSTVKKSSRRFSTETTSESIEEIDDHSPRNKPIRSGRPTEDFSTHGFPSVKPNKPTQEYPTDRPHSATPSNDFSTQGFPSVKPNKMTQEYPTQRPHPVNELDMYVVQDSRRNTESSPRNLTKNTDDDVVVVSSESTRNFKHKTNSERTIETEVVTSGSDRTKQIESTTTNKSEDYSHGFPSVKGSSPLREISPRQGTPTRQTQPNDDFSTHGFPSVRSPTKGAPDYTTHGFPSSRDVIKSNKNIIVTPSSRGEEVITISSERTKNAKHNTTSERIIEMEVATDDDYTSSRPGNQNKNKPEDFSTHGFPSVKDKTPTREFSPRHDEYIPKSPTKTPDYSTHGFPSAKDSNKPRSVAPRHSPTTTTSTVKKPSAESAQKLIQKEKEVDAAHRAFAASLRSSSPIDNNRRDSYSDHHRQTPRSSVSSARTTPRRELREGSHDSAAPSEHSRISSTTVTRQSPTKTTGKTVVTKHTVVKTKNTNGSNETIDLTPQRSTKSPSPSKTTITTTTKTTTTKKLPAEVPKPDNQFTKPAENLFPINEPLTITKSNFTANDASFERNEAVEAPCIKKKFYLVGPSDKVSNKSIDELIVNNFPAQPQLSEIENQTNNDSKMTNTTTTNTTIQNTDGVEKSTERTDTERTEAPITTTKTTTVSTANKPENEDLTKHVTTANNQEQLLLHERSSPHSPAPNIHKPRTNANTRSPTRDYKPANIDDQIIIKSSSPIGKKNEERRTVVRESTFEKPQTANEPVAEIPYETDLTENIFEIIDDIEKVKNKTHFSSEQIEVSDKTFDEHDHVQTRSQKKNKNKQPIQPSELNKPMHTKQPVQPKQTTQGPKTINTEVINRKTKTIHSKNIDSNSVIPDQNKEPLNRSPDTDEEEFIPTTENETTIVEEILEIGTKNSDIPKDQKKFSKPKYDNQNIKTKPLSRTPSPEKTTSTTRDTIFSKTHINEIKPVTKPTLSTNEKNDTLKTQKYDDNAKVEELFEQTNHKKQITSKHNIDEFISNELKHQLPSTKELPDGSLISKSKEPVPTSPTFKKKGLSRRETFEERCRQILGMEDNGDTQGKYQNRPEFEPKHDEDTPKELIENQNDVLQFEVTIEDCNDDEPLDINNVKKSLLKKELIESKKKHITKNPEEVFEPQPTTSDKNKTNAINKYVKEDLHTVDTTNDNIIKTTKVLQPQQPREKNKLIEKTTIVIENQRSKPKLSEPCEETHSSDSETESSGNITEVETEQENYVSEKVVNLDDILSSQITEKSIKTESVPKTKNTKTPNKSSNDTVETKRTSKSVSTTKQTVSNKNDEQAVTKQQPRKPTTKQPSRDNLTKPNDKSIITQVSQRTTQKSNIEKTSKSITKDKTSPRPSRVQRKSVDNSGDSSPDISPSRLSERRRSSNISVHTEIIIEHASPKSPRKYETTPKTQPRTVKEPTEKDLLEKTLTHKPTRKLAVTERKESAPVQRVSRKDKDVKMPRSTSEQKIKVGTKPVAKPDMNSLSPNLSVKSDNRPNKCFATKTINLVTIDKTLNSEDMENVIIDIQQAKSSREPSPDKIVPTPVPAGMDTGKPRYPDVVQEPEEEPRKKPQVKNIPIFEEETNEYVGCQISEVQTEQITKTKEYVDYNDDNIDNPIVEAPKSLDYTTVNKSDDESLLSVQEKVSKFIHTAEEVKKPKVSSPFSRDFAQESTVPENDDSLLTVDQKVTKFLQTAESITKPVFSTKPEFERPKYDDLDEDLRHDNCILSVSQKVNKFIDTAEKLAPTTPQKSPELVAKIERHISRQSEPEYPNLSDQEESITPFSENHTIEIEMKRQKDILSRPSIWQNKKDEDNITTQTTVKNIYNNSDDEKEPLTEDELIPMTKKHTIGIELKRQNDILSRPSVFQTNNVPQKQPIPSEPKTHLKTKEKVPHKIGVVSGKIDVENSVSDFKNRTKSISKYQSSTLSTTKSKFETPKNEISPNKRKPSFENEKPMKSGPKNQTLTKLDVTTNEIHSQNSESENELNFTTKRRSSSKVKDNITNIEDKVPHSKKPTHTSSPQHKKSTNNSHSPIQSPNTFTKTNVTKITERTSTHTTPTKIITTDTVESILEPSSPASQSPITKGKTKMTTTESIAARRNIFEKGVPTKTNKTNTPVQTGRRPSYMDHTMSSLEHRKDSLELNKTNYARKSSTEDDSLYDRRPNTAVKFRVPEKSVEGPISNIDDVNIEEIFDLEVLEQMLEITTSYEIRRRIRAQIRLVKKNMLNTQYIERANADTQKSTVFTTSEKTAKTMSTYETKDRSMINTKTTRKPIERSFSPDDRSNESVQESEDFECHRKPREHSPTSKTISSSLKEIRRVTDTSRSHPQDTVLTEEIVTVKIDKSKNRSTDQNFETRTDKQRIGSESPTCTYKSQDQVTVHVERIPKSSRDHSPEAKTISSSLKEVRRSTERNQHSEAIPSKGTMPTKHRDESISPSRSKPREPSPEWKNMSNTAKQGSRITEISTKETITTEKTIKNRKQSDSSISPTRSKSRDHSPEAKTTKSSLKERKQREGSISPTSSKSPDHSPEAKTISSMLKEVRRVSGEQESYSTQRKTQMEVVDTVEKVRTPILEKKRLPISSPERISKPLSRQESATPKGQSVARTQSPDKLKKQEYGLSSQKEETTRKRTDNASKVQPKPRVPQTSDNRTGKQQERENYTVTRTTVRTTYSPERKQSQTKVDEKTPIWADRKNILKNQGSNIVKKTPSPSTTRSNVTRTIKSSTQQQSRTFNEEDSITSSYGIGPTDENGLPLFGIKALRKKKQPEQPCETKEEVTGYIVEEKYFSDNKTKPTVQRKEYIYSTNADELEQIKKKVDSQKTSKDTEVTRTFEQIETGNELDGMKALTMSMPTTEEFSTSSTKHVRRGSVKEMSEKFIRKESSQSITEKSSSYPKAGLILRSTPRLSSGDATDAFESTTDIITKKFSSNDSKQDFDTEDHEFDMEQSKTVQTESESECESVKILRVTNQKSTRSSTSTRSFLNTSGDSKVVTGVDDVLERMRNADNVVEEGDTAEDQEARALLNKFLGASVIMRGVESALPTKQTRTTVTTYADGDGDGGGDKRKREIKTTRVTKTIKSGSSSSPVTYKTCAIEEIWDEELLKELLEQATNYEERRKIRARLRELMAEREENKNLKASEKATPAANTEDDESSASEYEEIIEEVTDYSESEDETELKKNTSIKKENDEEITKATIVKEDSEKAVLKKSSSTKSNDSLKTDISTTSFVSVEEIEEVVDKNIEKSKENVKNIVIEKVTSAVENLTTKTADSEDIAICADTQKTEQEQQQHATSTTERSETKEKDGSIVTTTTKVTTRTVSGTGPKPVSPFAKFRQLDKQNSQQSPRTSK
ncbi:titin isoform X3 [Teleopsis dalmanni]|uniref:titin isoform X3 n=1 Tax=Teleopsis dalmanni TaxID=139649 RepID=UPI0018CE12B6|nr:titin isoform X3 [Teleopsis dalmanni]